MRSTGAMWAAIALVFAGTAAEAELNRLQPDFTFRRVTVPTTGTQRRITVQIDPSAPRRPQAPAAAGTVVAGGGGSTGALPLDWFWADISPAMAASGPGRLQPALVRIGNPPEGMAVPVPRLQTMQDIAREHGIEILRATVGTDVSPALVVALISIESAGQAAAESSAGAVGLMQLMPATAERFGVTDRTDPKQNIAGGVAYLAWLMQHFNNDPILVLAGYNAGEGAVRDNGGVPPYPETRAYVPKVLAAFDLARGLCQTPPELVSDGCVFAVNNL